MSLAIIDALNDFSTYYQARIYDWLFEDFSRQLSSEVTDSQWSFNRPKEEKFWLHHLTPNRNNNRENIDSQQGLKSVQMCLNNDA